jgi:hypothetical protein
LLPAIEKRGAGENRKETREWSAACALGRLERNRDLMCRLTVCKSLNGRSSVASNKHVATSNGKRGQTETRKSAKNRRSPIRLFGSTADRLPYVVIASCYSALLIEKIRSVSYRASSIRTSYLRRLISGIDTANDATPQRCELLPSTMANGQGRALGDSMGSPVNFDRGTLTWTRQRLSGVRIQRIRDLHV